MSEYEIRQAKWAEADDVVEMIESLHEENHKHHGGIMVPGVKTRMWVRTVVGEALRGKGLVLVAVLDSTLLGVLVASEFEMPYDTPFKRLVAGHGTYVRPSARKMGIAQALYTDARKRLADLGYDAYLGAHLVKNERARSVIEKVGFVPFEVSVLMRLGDAEE